MESRYTQIRKDILLLEEAIDSFSPKTGIEKNNAIKSINIILAITIDTFSSRFFINPDITESEAKILANLLNICHKKLSAEKFPRSREHEYKNFIDLRIDLAEIVDMFYERFRHGSYFKNDEIRIPRAERIRTFACS